MRGASSFLITALWLVVALCPVAQAGVYPWVAVGESDIRVVADPRVDLHLRLKLIREATSTIDIINYDQRGDEAFGYPILSALRDAADRGVRVRYLVSAITQIFFDVREKLARYLIDPPTRTPIEYLIWGGPDEQDRGWGIFDGIHEKTFIVDGRYGLTSGRGYADVYLFWLDTSFALKGALLEQTKRAFEDTWNYVRRLKRPYGGNLHIHNNPSKIARRYVPNDVGSASAEQLAEVARVAEWMTVPSRPAELAGGAASLRGRVLHHDFIAQARTLTPTPAELTDKKRLKLLKDPVIAALSERIARSSEIRMAILSVLLHPELKRALLTALSHGASVRLLTNVHAPDVYSTVKHKIEPGGPIWALSLPDLDALLKAGARIFAFQSSKNRPWVYLHRKLAILDDTVFFGSHNFNLPSTLANDELSYEVEDPRLAAELRALFDADLAVSGEQLDPGRVARDHDRSTLELMRIFSTPFIGIM